MRWSFRQIPILLLVLSTFLASATGNEQLTRECLSQASFSDCTVFNRCCDFKCTQNTNSKANPFYLKQGHTCVSILGQISKDHTNCLCETSSAISSMDYGKGRWAKMDIVAGVVLIFIIDMLLLSFTF
ncbi:hypothetical protein L596_027524 [Steinernema carpocapsae]|uniref:Uncharacterized protein n=1 Tax=Steinernema carpocapsae TaxID=34508 RepID=A0A4U5LVR0_STECR|nr:hypothetical protein L596_027524 [Steinernema carpocapsae]